MDSEKDPEWQPPTVQRRKRTRKFSSDLLPIIPCEIEGQENVPAKRPRGRPKGAKNKVKSSPNPKPRPKRASQRKKAVVKEDMTKPINIRHYIVHRPFAIEDEKEMEWVIHETYLGKFNPHSGYTHDAPEGLEEPSDVEDEDHEEFESVDIAVEAMGDSEILD